MRSSLATLSLWIFISIDATTQEECPIPPKVNNAQISKDKSNYINGDEVDYICNDGYVSQRKITYKCKNNIWSQQRSAECTLKRCELPADIPNSHYTITKGKGFFVGSTIEYTCKDGYQMMSRIYTRTCRPTGWDNQLPVCEEVFCAVDFPSDKQIILEGLPDYGDLIRPGYRLHVSCAEKGYALKGPKEITCKSNGEWNEKNLHCEEITCKLNETNNVKVERISDHVGPIKPGQQINLSCNEQGMIIRDKRPIVCQENGEWNTTIPKCEEATCVANVTNQIIDGQHNPGVIVHKPGKKIKVSCGQKLDLKGQEYITCQQDGEWSSRFPLCAATTCEPPSSTSHLNADTIHILDNKKKEYSLGEKVEYRCFNTYIMEGNPFLICQEGTWKEQFKCIQITCKLNETNNVKVERISDHVGPIKPGQQIKLSCNEQGMIIRDKRPIVCQENGEWNTTIPKCEEATCVANVTNQIIDGQHNPGVIVHKPGKKIKVSCGQKLDLKGQEYITCQQDGEWSSRFPLCAATTCEPPSSTSHLNADTIHILDNKKKEYSLGEKVEYRCFNTYIMEGNPFLICQEGTWKEQFKCIPPCLASVKEMDQRNIQLQHGGRERMYCPHKDHITLMCQGKTQQKPNSVPFRQQCLYGQMTLPECE